MASFPIMMGFVGQKRLSEIAPGILQSLEIERIKQFSEIKAQ